MIERSPYKVERTEDGRYRVVDPAYPVADTSMYIRGTFDKEIDAINYSSKLWADDIAAKEAATGK